MEPRQIDAELKKIKVWYDHKRDCYVSNAGFVWARIWETTPQIATAVLVAYTNSLGLDWVEDVWAS